MEKGVSPNFTQGLLVPNVLRTGEQGIGTQLSPYQVLRTYFVYDLASQIPATDGPIVSAVFRIGMGDAHSPDASETFNLYSVDSVAASQVGTRNGIDIWNDLGDGAVYATQVVPLHGGPSEYLIPLNDSAIAALNGARAGGLFAMGGALDTITPGGVIEYIFDGGGLSPDIFGTVDLMINTAPMIVSLTASPNPACVNETVSFCAEASDADGDALTYTWNFGDGSPLVIDGPQSSGGSAQYHAYSAPGTYSASVTANDGKTPAAQRPVRSVSVVVLQPTLTVTPEDAATGCEVEFIATSIFPEDVQFFGDLGDTPQVTVTGDTAVLTTTYSTPGAKTVTATFKECPPLNATAYIYRVVFNTDIIVCKGAKKSFTVTLEGARPLEVTISASANPDIARDGPAGTIKFTGAAEATPAQLTLTLDVAEITEIEFEGVSPSNKMHDILVTTDPKACVFEEGDFARVTVLWVEWSIRTTPGQEIENEKLRFIAERTPYIGSKVLGPINDGTNGTKALAYLVELVGSVKPGDFNLRIAIHRTISGMTVWKREKNGGQLGDPHCDSGLSNGSDDRSHRRFLDEDPQPDGKIYDLDGPGIALPVGSVGTIFAYRGLFTESANFAGEKCSEDFPWFATRTIKKGDDGKWTSTYEVMGAASDNTAGAGNGPLTGTGYDGKPVGFNAILSAAPPRGTVEFTTNLTLKLAGGTPPFGIQVFTQDQDPLRPELRQPISMTRIDNSTYTGKLTITKAVAEKFKPEYRIVATANVWAADGSKACAGVSIQIAEPVVPVITIGNCDRNSCTLTSSNSEPRGKISKRSWVIVFFANEAIIQAPQKVPDKEQVVLTWPEKSTHAWTELSVTADNVSDSDFQKIERPPPP